MSFSITLVLVRRLRNLMITLFGRFLSLLVAFPSDAALVLSPGFLNGSHLSTREAMGDFDLFKIHWRFDGEILVEQL